MDSISFDYDDYLSEETFVIDDFGEICEDVVRIASNNSQYLCKDYDNELRHESPPPASFIATNRCFEKDITSLFSEMEYLTEVSPGSDVVLSGMKAITVVVNPTELSCNRSMIRDETPKKANEETFPECRIDSFPETTNAKADTTQDAINWSGNLSVPVDYQRILNNYIQKGRRKLEASSYSKMKAPCHARESLIIRSTSHTDTGSTPSRKPQRQQPAMHGDLVQVHPNTSVTANVNDLPSSMSDTVFDKVSSITESSKEGDTIQVSNVSSPLPKVHQSAAKRPTAGSLKMARIYCCQDCNCSFTSSELMRKHSCIIAEQYQCHMCLREFKKRKTLDHHMKSHDKVFSTDDDLRK